MEEGGSPSAAILPQNRPGVKGYGSPAGAALTEIVLEAPPRSG
jgi:hypothetical protein